MQCWRPSGPNARPHVTCLPSHHLLSLGQVMRSRTPAAPPARASARRLAAASCRLSRRSWTASSPGRRRPVAWRLAGQVRQRHAGRHRSRVPPQRGCCTSRLRPWRTWPQARPRARAAPRTRAPRRGATTSAAGRPSPPTPARPRSTASRRRAAPPRREGPWCARTASPRGPTAAPTSRRSRNSPTTSRASSPVRSVRPATSRARLMRRPRPVSCHTKSLPCGNPSATQAAPRRRACPSAASTSRAATLR